MELKVLILSESDDELVLESVHQQKSAGPLQPTG